MVEVWRIGLEDWEVILDLLEDGEERPGIQSQSAMYDNEGLIENPSQSASFVGGNLKDQ